MAVGPKTQFTFDNDETDIAVALSGGGDSMALAHMVCLWADRHDRHVHLLTVDHGLRPDSRDEAVQVGQWVADFPSSHHHILTWTHGGHGNPDDVPQTAVMEKARTARYDLMTSYCRAHNIQTLCVAHHSDDQVETFLFRLAKGSGIDGLSAMRERVAVDRCDNNGTDHDDTKIVTIYRPLLQMSHDDLIGYCREHGISWVEDPSNENEKYARPRLRKALQEEGLNAKRMAVTVQRLSRARDALTWMADQAFGQCCMTDGVVDWGRLQTYPDEIVVRVMQKLLMKKGGGDHHYPPRMERVEEMVKTLRPNKSATLHHCILHLSKDGKTLEIKGV